MKSESSKNIQMDVAMTDATSWRTGLDQNIQDGEETWTCRYVWV